jgi:amino acid transporter
MTRHYSTVKRRILGRPLATFAEKHERLGRPTGLSVFASDAISSTAYASEEILRVLIPVVALAAISELVPIALVVCALLIIVIASYRQTIHAYPSGGGSYIVARENLGTHPSLVAGASLLVDYILTAAVSVSAGVAAITSAYPGLFAYRVELCVGFIGLISVANLRGIRESGRLFAAPTFIYVFMLGLLIAVGLARSYSGGLARLPENKAALDQLTSNGTTLGVLTPFLLLRAFSSGAVALTGVEAISNGVPAFKRPESKNAASTLVVMGVILGIGFLGTAVLTQRLHPTLTADETLLSILGKAVFGGGPIYAALQFSTFAILVLAANTAFADFPRLSSLLASDGFLPRQFATRGDRLVFSNGVVFLAAMSAVLLIVFSGDTSALIPLYAVGVFTGFTISQTGMVRHHFRLREPHWQRNAFINGLGAVSTFVVLLVVLISKFTIGAWIPAVLIPILVVLFKVIAEHYRRAEVDLASPAGTPQAENIVVLLVGRVHRGTVESLQYARLLRPDHMYAMHVSTDGSGGSAVRDAWDTQGLRVPLVIQPSPYRDLNGPVFRYIDQIERRHPDAMVTVVIPDYVEAHVFDNLLHNQSTLALTTRLRERPNTVVVMVPLLAERARRLHEPQPVHTASLVDTRSPE